MKLVAESPSLAADEDSLDDGTAVIIAKNEPCEDGETEIMQQNITSAPKGADSVVDVAGRLGPGVTPLQQLAPLRRRRP